VARRLRNTSRKIPHGRRLEILEDLFTKMKTSDHSDKFMRNVAIKGIISYENKVRRSLLDKSNPAYLLLYMGSYNSRGRAKVKAQKKTNWFRSSETETGSSRYPAMKKSKLGTKGRKSFKKAGKKQQPSSVIFVPNTKRGILTEKLRENEDRLAEITGFRMKFQEAGGLQLKNCFSTELSKGKHCGRINCPPCNQTSEEKRQNCRTQNILYETKCLLCNPPVTTPQEEKERKMAGRRGIYYGETSRSFQERMSEHLSDAEKFHPKSHITKHWMTEHREEQQIPLFAFSIVQKYKDCLSRQIGEAVKIFHTRDNILNSKCEYLSNCITRLTVLEDDWERKQRERNEEEEENREQALLEEFRKEKMGKDDVTEEQTSQEEDVMMEEEKLLEEDPDSFRKSRKEKDKDSRNSSH
jgi:hypothetical protein